MPISLKQLEIFRAVVVSGSISTAAKRMRLSQPTMSQQLAKVEEILGVQLVIRNRSGVIELTNAGEYWFKAANDMIKRFDGLMAEHKSRFGDGKFDVRMGATPTLRVRFASAVARMVLEDDQLARFDLFWGLSSSEVVDQLRLHHVNFAIVNSVAVEPAIASHEVTPVFEDRIAWVVPREIPTSALVAAISANSTVLKKYPALGRHVTLGREMPMQPASDDWYRQFVPRSNPSFGVMTYLSGVELVAEGICTCHCPLSLLPNLPSLLANRLRWYVLPNFKRDIVVVVPKHLLSLKPYARLRNRVLDFFQHEYSGEMASPRVLNMESLLSKAKL
jgi:DNA-binding transcriptional LysR family regulator